MRQESNDIAVPAFYALLPTLPLFLILLFGLVIESVKMDITVATFVSLAITMLIEFIRHRNGLKLCTDLKSFWDGMTGT